MLKILFLEDDPIISDIIIEYLSANNYKVDYAFDIDDAIDFLDKNSYDIFLFDVQVPNGNGFEFLEELRKNKNKTPAIFITALSDINSMKIGFNSGCDDYIKKPFELPELELRLNNIKKIYNINMIISIDKNIILDKSKSLININGKEYGISNKKIKILEFLSKNHNRIISYEELSSNIWGYDTLPSDATIRTHIKELRQILGNEKISTTRGVGYRFIKE